MIETGLVVEWLLCSVLLKPLIKCDTAQQNHEVGLDGPNKANRPS